MAKKTNELAAPDDVQSYAIMKADPAKVGALLAENLGGDDLSEFDLEKIKWPSGGIPAFPRNTDEGTVTLNTLTGVVIYHGTRRAFWHEKYGQGESGPPQCSSVDGRTGTGHYPGEKLDGPAMTRGCRRCPYNQFGSGTNDKGERTKGKACQERKMIFMALPDSILPVGVSLPPTSLKPWKDYAMHCASKGKDIRAVVTEISLEVKKNDGGVDYSVGKFKIVKDLTDAELEGVMSMAHSLKEVFANVGIDGDEDMPDHYQPTVHGQVVDHPQD